MARNTSPTPTNNATGASMPTSLKPLYAEEDLGLELDVYALDSSTIDLWSVFPLGALPPDQGGSQTPYIAGLAG